MKLELSTTDIEEFAVSSVESEIHKYPECLKAHINKGDKLPMWDGSISIYNNYAKTNNDWEYKFDIQVKGTQVESFSNGNIKFPLDVVILKNYQKTGTGTLFFVVEVINSYTTKIYYKNLLPVDIAEILNKVKDDQKTISVLFRPIIEKSPSSIKHICLKFAQNSKLQQGKLIKNINELKDIKNIEIPIILENGENFEDALLTPNTDIYSYATLNNGQQFILPKLKKIYQVGETNVNVTVKEKIYYNKITFLKNKQEFSIQIGKSLTCYVDKNKINFKPTGNLYERIKDINFILDVTENNEFYINNTKFEGIDINTFGNDFIKNIKIELEKLEEIKSLFEKYNIKFDIDFSSLTEDDWKNIFRFKQINDGKYLKPDLNMGLYHITISKYKIIFLTVKRNNTFLAYNYFNDLKNIVKVFYFDSNKNQETMSPYINLTESDLLTASNFNANIVKESFHTVDISKETTCDYIRAFVLNLLNAFDKNPSRLDLLNLSYDLNKLSTVNFSKDIDSINTYQIIKRMRALSDEELDKIYLIKNNNKDLYVQVAISLLLENKSDFNRYFKQLSSVEQENFKSFPIYHLNNF